MSNHEEENPFSSIVLKAMKDSSVGLPDGGDTHFHIWKDDIGAGVTATTRLPGGLAFHDNLRDFTDGVGSSGTQLEAPPLFQPPPLV